MPTLTHNLFPPRLSVDGRSRAIGIALVLAAMVLWSTVPVFTKLLMKEGQGYAFSETFISAGRLWTAAIIFLLVRLLHARHSGIPLRVPVRRTGWLLVAAAALVFNYLLYAYGLRFTTAGATTIVSQVHPILTVLLAAWLLGERLTPQKLIGITLSIAGVLLVLFQGANWRALLDDRHFFGNMVEIVAALSWPFYAIGQTKLIRDGDRDVLMPIFFTAAVLVTLLLPVSGPIFRHTPALADWLMLAFLGVGSTAAAYWLFAAGLQRIETSEGAMFNVIMPPVALLMAWALLKETPPPMMITGLVLVLLGLACIVWRRGNSPVRRKTAGALAKDGAV